VSFFQTYRNELRRQERVATAPRAPMPAGMSEQGRFDLAMQIRDLERQLTAVRIDLRQLQGVVDQGLADYRPALAAKQIEADCLEARVNALHAQKERA
jgi:hypothetical protein